MATRRQQLLRGAAIGAPALCALILWFGVAPGVVRERAERALSARLGVTTTVGGASLRVRGVVLSDVHIASASGGLDVHLDAVGVRGQLLALATRGAAAVEYVQVRGARVAVDSSRGDLNAVLSRALRSDAAGTAASDVTATRQAGGHAPVLEARDADITWRDAHGLLVRTSQADIRLDGARLELGATRLEGDPDIAGSSVLLGARAHLYRGHAGWTLADAEVSGGQIVWEDASLQDAPADDTAPPAARFLDRVRAAVVALLPSRGDPSGDDEERDDAAERWLRRLAPDVRLVIHDVDLETHGLGRPAVRIDNLDAEVLAEDGGWLRLRGSGQPSGEGSLEWDVRVSPEELRGEGHATFEGISLALVAPLLPDVPWYEADRATLSGHLRIEAESPARLALEGDVTLSDAAVSSPRIAPVPVFDINVSAAGNAYFMPLERRLEITRGTLRVGEAEARVGGTLELDDEHYAVNVRASMNATPCDVVMRAVPEDLLGELRGFSWSGELGGVASLRVDSRDLEATALRVEVSDGCEFVSVPALADLRRVQAPFRHEVQEPDGTMFSMTTGPGTANWVSIHAMSPYFIHAVLAHEDAGFFNHTGFSMLSVERALVRNLREGRFVLGASTISMQLAKNLFLNREKTLARKVQEALLTWWLETALTKKKLLELYLNIIEYGPGVYGIRHAARYYFGRDADELSPAESAFLACVLPAPKRMHSYYAQGRLGPSMRDRMARLMRHMRERGRMDQAALEYGLSELANFRFRRGGGPPEHRAIPGTPGRLPFSTVVTSDEDWDSWEDAGALTEPERDQFDGLD
ncbi:MAG: transglycosylase domain-containing protein [Myxococcales bacterium]|nr:transglycosylase domain-containing protein [Myxococcales bacterium]MCB9627936.1 transglycosylase domain-containing protein [Sandaracinaceae bacterium]